MAKHNPHAAIEMLRNSELSLATRTRVERELAPGQHRAIGERLLEDHPFGRTRGRERIRARQGVAAFVATMRDDVAGAHELLGSEERYVPPAAEAAAVIGLTAKASASEKRKLLPRVLERLATAFYHSRTDMPSGDDHLGISERRWLGTVARWMENGAEDPAAATAFLEAADAAKPDGIVPLGLSHGAIVAAGMRSATKPQIERAFEAAEYYPTVEKLLDLHAQLDRVPGRTKQFARRLDAAYVKLSADHGSNVKLLAARLALNPDEKSQRTILRSVLEHGARTPDLLFLATRRALHPALLVELAARMKEASSITAVWRRLHPEAREQLLSELLTRMHNDTTVPYDDHLRATAAGSELEVAFALHLLGQEDQSDHKLDSSVAGVVSDALATYHGRVVRWVDGMTGTPPWLQGKERMLEAIAPQEPPGASAPDTSPKVRVARRAMAEMYTGRMSSSWTRSLLALRREADFLAPRPDISGDAESFARAVDQFFEQWAHETLAGGLRTGDQVAQMLAAVVDAVAEQTGQDIRSQLSASLPTNPEHAFASELRDQGNQAEVRERRAAEVYTARLNQAESARDVRWVAKHHSQLDTADPVEAAIRGALEIAAAHRQVHDPIIAYSMGPEGARDAESSIAHSVLGSRDGLLRTQAVDRFAGAQGAPALAFYRIEAEQVTEALERLLPKR